MDTDAPSELDEVELRPYTVLTMFAQGLHNFINVWASIRHAMTVESCVRQLWHTSNTGLSGVRPADLAGGPCVLHEESLAADVASCNPEGFPRVIVGPRGIDSRLARRGAMQ